MKKTTRYLFADIEKAVCVFFSIQRADLKGPSLARKFAYPRFIAVYLARELTNLTLSQIAIQLGRRNHTSILAGQRRAAALIEYDQNFSAQVLAVREILKALAVKPARIIVNGHDVTDRMPLTAAEMQRQRAICGAL